MSALFLLPIIYIAVLIVLIVKKSRTGIGISLALFAVAFATYWWAVMQSRSSTASLGFLVLPSFAALVGFLGLAYGRWERSLGPRRIMGRIALGLAVLVTLWVVREGFATRSRYDAREDTQARLDAEIARNREMIATGLRNNRGRERVYLDSSIRARINDRAFLIAALPNDSISAGILDTLAASTDGGVALLAVRNRGTAAATLARVYGEKSYPGYFSQALAGNPNTPPEILRDLYRNPGVSSGLAIWLAGNPATPRDVLDQISRTTADDNVIRQLRENPVWVPASGSER